MSNYLIKRLKDFLLIDKVLKVLHEEREQNIAFVFQQLIGNMVWEHIEFFNCSYDFDNDVYITFTCDNKYREDINKKLEDIFGATFDYGGGDYYTEYQIPSSYIFEMEA